MSEKGISPSAMTREQATAFVESVKVSENPVVKEFVGNIETASGRRPATEALEVATPKANSSIRALGKTLGVLGIALTLLDAWEFAEEAQRCEEDPCSCYICA